MKKLIALLLAFVMVFALVAGNWELDVVYWGYAKECSILLCRSNLCGWVCRVWFCFCRGSGFIVFLKTVIWGDPVAGFPTLMCMMMLIGGLLMLFLGIIGQYLSRIYIEVKKRPVYLVKETEQDNK